MTCTTTRTSWRSESVIIAVLHGVTDSHPSLCSGEGLLHTRRWAALDMQEVRGSSPLPPTMLQGKDLRVGRVRHSKAGFSPVASISRPEGSISRLPGPPRVGTGGDRSSWAA